MTVQDVGGPVPVFAEESPAAVAVTVANGRGRVRRYGWDGGSGGCDKLGTVPLSVTWQGRPTRAAPR